MVTHAAPPERTYRDHEDDAAIAGELCIRFMERTLEGVMANPALAEHYNDFFTLLGDVVQHELKEFALDFAYELFSDEHVIRSRRLAFEQKALQE